LANPIGMVHGGISIIQDFAKFKKLMMIFLISSSLLFSIVPINTAFASTTFSIEGKNISISLPDNSAVTPKVVVDGSNVYVIWREGADIFFDRSTDGGATFAGPVNLSGSASVTSLKQHHISISGGNIYVMWREDVGGISDIFVSSSTDGGATFSVNPINISDSPAVSEEPQIASSGNNAYVLWTEGNADLKFSRTTDSGSNFSLPQILTNALFLLTPDIAADGVNVYAVWSAGLSDIQFIRSADSGLTFSAVDPIGGTGGTFDPKPRIAASGTDVFVVWNEGVKLSFVKSSNSGTTFNAKIELDSTGVSTQEHQIALSGSNVYVVWKDGTDIGFRQSTDGGATFDPQDNLSETGVSSSQPDLAAGSVFVVWREGTGVPNDILLESSSTDGSNFGGIQSITSNTMLSSDPKVAVSGNDVYVVWSEATSAVSGDGEIKFSKGTVISTSIDFPGPYKMTDTATITVTDGASNLDPAVQEMILVNVTSGIDPAGILITATENGTNSSDFIANITFTTSASAGTTLQATPVPTLNANALTATFGGVSTVTTIFPRSIVFDSTKYDPGIIASITVTDQNSNLDPLTIESIVVDLSTQEAGDAETVTLLETGIDTGVFGGNGAVELIFAEGDNRFTTSGTVTLTVNNSTALNQNNTKIDVGLASVTSSSDTKGINFTITETGLDTGNFTGKIVLTPGATNEAVGKIHVEGGDFLMLLTASPTFRLNALIVPNPNESRELLDVLIDETITASFGGVSDSATVGLGGGGGGGGGGVTRPGLVFNAILGASLFGGGGSFSGKPTISSTSLTFYAEPSFTQLEEGTEFGGIIREKILDDSSNTQVLTIGKKIELKLDMSTSRGFENIVHVSFYLLNDGEKRSLKDSTYIIYDKYKGMTINDPDGIFDDAAIDLIKKSASTGVVKISFTINKAVGMKDFFIQSWNEQKRSNEWTFNDAIFVSGPTEKELPGDLELPFTQTENPLNSDKTESEQIEDVQLLSTEETTTIKTISPWIKTTTKWWVENQVRDQEFLMAIEYLIEEGIIEVQEQELIATDGRTSIPSWFRVAANWWANGDTPDGEFINGLEWLIKNEVIKV